MGIRTESIKKCMKEYMKKYTKKYTKKHTKGYAGEYANGYTIEQDIQKKKIKKQTKRGYILPVLIFVLMIGMLIGGVNSVTRETAKKEQESLQNAVIQSAVHCYSVEGAYPDSLDYLKKHYGITWDETKYKVSYDIIAKNIRPEVKVIPLNE